MRAGKQTSETRAMYSLLPVLLCFQVHHEKINNVLKRLIFKFPRKLFNGTISGYATRKCIFIVNVENP